MTREPVIHFSSLLDRAALEHLKSKTLLPSFSHYDVWLYEHAVGFTVAKMMNADLLQTTKNAIAQAIESGQAYDKFVKNLKPYLMAQGWWGESVMTDPVDGVAKTVQLGSTRRLRVIFQTNLATAYAAGQWARVQEDKADFPYLKYIASTAEQKRASHMSYYGKIWRVDDPIWQSIFPPNGYGCQCTVRQLNEKQALRERGEDINRQPEKFTERQKANHAKGMIDDGTDDIQWVDFTNPRTGQSVKIPFDVTPTFAHNHGDRLGALQKLMQDKHGKQITQQIEQQTYQYVVQKVVRPNFDILDFVPNLTVVHTDIENAQFIVNTYAGTGSQFGSVPVGQVGSFEWFKKGRQYFLLEYSENGVQLNRIKRSELAWLKENEIKAILENNASHYELNKLQELWQQIQDLDLGQADFADKLAAYLYTTNAGYEAVNPKLIDVKGNLSAIAQNEIVQMIRLIDDFLARSPKFKGVTIRKLSRSRMSDDVAFLSSHVKGNFVRYSNFSSTSKPDGEFGGNNPDILLTINGKSGVDISKLSAYAAEGEVLMPRHVVYRVLNQYEKDGTIHIELEEVSEKQYNGQNIMQLGLERLKR